MVYDSSNTLKAMVDKENPVVLFDVDIVCLSFNRTPDKHGNELANGRPINPCLR